MSLLSSLRHSKSTVAVELRPPRADLDAAAGIDAWIDTYHAVRGLTNEDTCVFLTDSAVGQQEEHNLRHLVTNLGQDAPRDHVVPFLTAKHTLQYCLDYSKRAWEHGFRSLVVLGGDNTHGPPRCVDRGWKLRKAIREIQPSLELGGWANPHNDPVRQVGYLLEPTVTADFFLTQVVSHHNVETIERFLLEIERQNLLLPSIFGVFYYRSANRRTLDALSPFLPVPREKITREFDSGSTPQEVCARTIRTLWSLGVNNIYVSNLPSESAQITLRTILRCAIQT